MVWSDTSLCVCFCFFVCPVAYGSSCLTRDQAWANALIPGPPGNLLGAFNLYFPVDWWYWVSFHVLMWMNTFLDPFSTLIWLSFYYWVVDYYFLTYHCFSYKDRHSPLYKARIKIRKLEHRFSHTSRREESARFNINISSLNHRLPSTRTSLYYSNQDILTKWVM